MQRLRGADAQFLYNESKTSPFVTLKVMIYEPTTPGQPPRFSEIKNFIAAGISNWINNGLGMRVVRVPFDIHHPIWFKDKNFCLDNHIHHSALPAPGGKEELCSMISQVMSTPLDSNRPLWNSWIVEGLEGGKIAWVCKVHHVLADGLMSAEHIVNIHQNRSTKTYSPADYIFRDADDIPNKSALIWPALVDLAKTYTLQAPKYYRRYKKAKAACKSLSQPSEEAYRAFMAPYTRLNHPGDRYITFRYESFPLGEFKQLSRQLDCTINDLVLTLFSEALRHYLQDLEPLPKTPLVVIMPIANQGDDDEPKLYNTEIRNNNVSVAFVPIDLRIEDFYERLSCIKKGAKNAIEEVRRTKGTTMNSFSEFMPGSFFRLLNWVFAKRQKNKKNPMANMSISNVPGPRETLMACDGRLKMVELLSCGNLGDITSMGVTVWSYIDTLCFSCFFRKDVLPEPEKFTHYLTAAYRKILTAETENKTKQSHHG